MGDAAFQGGTSGFLRSRVAQVHPTLRCNLSCTHCYSASGPEYREALSPERLCHLLRILKGQGYEVISFSGGEPLLYEPLIEVVREARQIGLRVNLVTNGLLAGKSRFHELWELVSRVGVSLDGPEHLHDAMRGANAFSAASRALRVLSEHQVLVGVAHCVTTDSLGYLPWVAEFAAKAGAQLLQLHPLVAQGRASGHRVLLQSQQDRLFLLAEMLRIQYEPAMQVQSDLVPVKHLLSAVSAYAVLRSHSERQDSATLSDLVNPLVVDQRGHLWPLVYGLNSRQRIASADLDFADQIDAYLLSGARPLKLLLQSAVEGLSNSGTTFTDWYGHLVSQSRRNSVDCLVGSNATFRAP